MLHAVLIPHEAIQALATNGKMLTRLGRVQPLFTLKQASQTLGMSAKQIMQLIRSKKLFGVVPKNEKA